MFGLRILLMWSGFLEFGLPTECMYAFSRSRSLFRRSRIAFARSSAGIDQEFSPRIQKSFTNWVRIYLRRSAMEPLHRMPQGGDHYCGAVCCVKTCVRTL